MGRTENRLEVAKGYRSWLKAPFIPANAAKQTFVKSWPTLTPAKSVTSFGRKFMGLPCNNIAIVLGRNAEGLCSIDWDKQDGLEAFLRLNPTLQKTLISQANRGANIWVRIEGDYPPNAKLKRGNEPVGEWRADGSYTIIDGIHETGKRYIHNRLDPIQISFREIRWPKGISPFNATLDCNFTESTEKTENTESTEETEDTEDVRKGGVSTVADVVAFSLATRPHSTCDRQFVCCRGIRSLEKQRGQPFTIEEIKQVFDMWYKASLPNLRDGQSKDQYWLEFLDRYHKAKHPLGANDAVLNAWKNAQSGPMPKEAMQFEDQNIQALVALLYYLQKEVGDRDMFLATRTCETLLAGKLSHTTVATNFRSFKHLGIIKEVSPGTNVKSPRLRYVNVEQT